MKCRCSEVDVLYGTEAEEYAAAHLVSTADALTCPDTGARWRAERRGDQELLRQVDPELHLTRREQH